MNLQRRMAIAGALLVIPVACFAGFAASQKVACHPPRVYSSGSHLGFYVGMTRDEAVDANATFPFDHRLFAIWDSDEPRDISTPRHSDRYPRTLADLRKPGWRREEWLFTRGPSWCLLSDRDVRLTFEDGRLRTISDELGYDGP